MMLGQLITQFPPDSYVVLTERLSTFANAPASGWLPAPHYFLGDADRYSATEVPNAVASVSRPRNRRAVAAVLARALRPLSDVFDVTAKVNELSRTAARIVAKEDLEIVLTPSGDPVFIVAAARAARATGRPLYVHLFDLFDRNRYTLPKRILALRNERAVLTEVRHLFVPNEAMSDYYRHRLGVDPIVVPNGTTIPPFESRPLHSGEATILYTGAVYWAQRDSLQRLVAALRSVPGVRLEVKTNASMRELTLAGLRADHLRAPFSSQDGALQAQRNADILYLPLAFRTSANDVIRTALPAKVAEYLVSGTPILVHAPPDSYISQYARKSKWGYVVDTPDANALAAALRKLLSDSQLRSSLVSSAYDEARRAHDFSKIGPDYLKYFA